MIDLSPWKVTDSEWVREREKQWPIFKKWALYGVGDDILVERYLMHVQAFYDRGQLEPVEEYHLEKLADYRYFALHPALTLQEARKLVDYCCLEGEGWKNGLKGGFQTYYLLGANYEDLIKAGVRDVAFIETCIEALIGKNYTEAASLREFDPLQRAADDSRAMLKYLGNWLYGDYGDLLPAMQVLPHLIEALSLIPKEKLNIVEFELNSLAKRLNRVYTFKIPEDDIRFTFIATFLEQLTAHEHILPEIKQAFDAVERRPPHA